MSILINMEMPKNCDECRIMIYEDTNCISVHELFCGCPIVFRAHPQHEENRPDYCPLIEVPKHGDLIDRDVLKSQVEDTTINAPYFKWLIDNIPIVVESEE